MASDRSPATVDFGTEAPMADILPFPQAARPERRQVTPVDASPAPTTWSPATDATVPGMLTGFALGALAGAALVCLRSVPASQIEAEGVLATELSDFTHAFVALDGARRLAEVYLVVDDHGDEVYRKVGDAEDRILALLPAWTLRLHVRDHQGRAPEHCVPAGLRRLPSR